VDQSVILNNEQLNAHFPEDDHIEGGLGKLTGQNILLGSKKA